MPPMTPTDYSAVRRLADRQGSGYWRSLQELAQSPDFLARNASEFADADQLWNAPLSRRKVFRLLGASMALAGVAGCTRQPEEDILPYVRMPEQMVPGQPRYYASTVNVAGYGHGVIAETHEGRPTKLEGNPDHPASLGACDAMAQASVLSLYDPDRAVGIREDGLASDLDALQTALAKRRQQWDGDGGAGLCFLTGTVTSPSQQAHFEAMRRRWPRARWFHHDPVSRRALFEASAALFGEPLEPHYHFGRAQVVLSLDADFLQAQPGFLRHARDLMARRRPRDNRDRWTRLYAVEATPAVTGAVADHRQGVAYHRVEAAARQLARALNLPVAAPSQEALSSEWVEALVTDLKAAGPAAVVVPGDQQPVAVHQLAQAINHKLGAFGTTVTWMPPVAEQPLAPDLKELVKAIDTGTVNSLVVLDSNPIYTAPADLGFAKRYRRVPWRLHWGLYHDETASASNWHLPAAHELEAWGDLRAFDGTVSLVQPMIRPLHGGHTALQALALVERGEQVDALTALRDYWQGRVGGSEFETFWRRSLRDGVVADERPRPISVTPRPDWAQRLPAQASVPEGLVLQLRPDPALWDGRYANNGWLQEMPRPITTLTWANALTVSPALAEQKGLVDGQVVQLQVEDQSLRVPVMVLPGQPAGTVSLTLGHGRRADSAGRVAGGVGVSAYRVRTSNQPWAMPVALEATSEHRELALIQTHHHIEGRDLIRSASLAEYRANPAFAQESHHELSLYPEPWPAEREDPHAWGMAIDLSACIGCNACVTACQAENNIPIVGPEEVARGHDLHWIRVDRYFSGPVDAPGMAFQPVPCMHCENAPCEYVCPVEATQHSADGLNQMIYQRCVGTRYCSQNCPYKVRRFNWFDYTSADAAYPAEPAVQNPDVTVRSRGVMEKCTYCVQRISSVRQQAEAEARPIRDGELQTACQQSCPTQAIVFGDLADRDSDVNRLKASPLNYSMLAHLNTRPRTTYLAAVRNPNETLAPPSREEGSDA